jgi:hypothetical protein
VFGFNFSAACVAPSLTIVFYISIWTDYTAAEIEFKLESLGKIENLSSRAQSHSAQIYQQNYRQAKVHFWKTFSYYFANGRI